MPDFGRWSANGGDPSLNEINRTDRFLDALASEQPVYATDPGEAELAQLLSGWRDEVRRPPVRNPLTVDDAEIAMRQSAPAARRRPRVPMAVVGSVAAAMLCLGGFGAVVYGAGPGDSLYGLRTLLFGEVQVPRDDAVVLAAQTELAEVQQLIDDGQWQEAQDRLQVITTTVAAVGDVERQQELVDQWQQLSVKVESRDVNATVPPNAPPVTLPEVPSDSPLPAILEPGTTTATTEPGDTTTPPTSPTTTPSTSPTTTPPTPTTTSPEQPVTTTPPPPTTTAPPTTTVPPTTTAPRTVTSAPVTTTSAALEAPSPSPSPLPTSPTDVVTVTPTTTPPISATRETAAGGGATSVPELPSIPETVVPGRQGSLDEGPDSRGVVPVPTVMPPVTTLPQIELPQLPVIGGDGGDDAGE